MPVPIAHRTPLGTPSSWQGIHKVRYLDIIRRDPVAIVNCTGQDWPHGAHCDLGRRTSGGTACPASGHPFELPQAQMVERVTSIARSSLTRRPVHPRDGRVVAYSRLGLRMRIERVAGGPAQDRRPDARAVLVESVAHRPAWGKTRDPFLENRPDRTRQAGGCRRPRPRMARNLQGSPRRHRPCIRRHHRHPWPAVLVVSLRGHGCTGRGQQNGFGSPKGQALMAKTQAEYRDGTSSRVPNTLHDEFWRDA